jgi:hypothetical protein
MDKHSAYRRRWIFVLTASLVILSSGNGTAAGPGQTPGASPPRFSLKIGGGASLLPGRGGDLNNLRLHLEDLYAVWEAETYYATSFDWKPMTYVYELPVELVILLKPRLGLGIGSGILIAASQGSYTWDYSRAAFLYGSGYADDNLVETTRDFKIRVIPAYLNLYLFQPLGALTVYSYGGLGYYWGKMTHSSTIDYELKRETRVLYAVPPIYTKSEEYGNLAIEENLHKGSLGFQGGVGVELALFRRLALGLEIFGRHLVFEGWQGSSTTDSTALIKRWDQDHGWYPDTTETGTLTREGTLWYSRIDDPLLDKETDAFYVEDAGASDSALLGPKREARIDLSSIGIRLTLRIHFGRFL